ncbi:MAG: hypothetical protein IJC44_06985 [Clostridia bacterium]|nr:hypothetical protein [Clostridia bacterium]
MPRKTAGTAPATARGSTERGVASTARQDGGSSGKNYEERDGSIGPRSLHFYKRLAEGGAAYIVMGDVSPVRTFSPTPKLFDDSQIPSFKALADALHAHGSKLGLQIFHPEYDVNAVGALINRSRALAGEAQAAKAAGVMETFVKKMAESGAVGKEAYAKLDHDMEHFTTEVSHEAMAGIRNAIAATETGAARLYMMQSLEKGGAGERTADIAAAIRSAYHTANSL